MHPKIQHYFRLERKLLAGMDHEARQNLPIITDAPQDRERLVMWLRYFDVHLGVRPTAVRYLLEGKMRAMTVVTERPEWLDSSYLPPEEGANVVPLRPANEPASNERW